MWYLKVLQATQEEHSIEDKKPFTRGCWLLMSLCMGDNLFEDSTQRMSVNRKGGDIQGATEDKLPPPIWGYHSRLRWKKPWWESTYCCCMASEERAFSCKVACLGPISCFLNSVFKIFFMWRNLSCCLIASGWFLNIDFPFTHLI